MKITNQLICEIKAHAEEIDRLKYGEVILKFQDGKAVWGDKLKRFGRLTRINERPGLNASGLSFIFPGRGGAGERFNSGVFDPKVMDRCFTLPDFVPEISEGIRSYA